MKLPPTSSSFCACGSRKDYAQCCEPYINDKQIPPTPEALMRSRYCAYSQGNIEYIANTMQGAAAQNFNAEQAQADAKHITWLGLNVIDAPPPHDNVGFVEFTAHYYANNTHHTMHEISEFHRENGRWYYVDGKVMN